jgi:uncharacterized protein (UPF0276 family)
MESRIRTAALTGSGIGLRAPHIAEVIATRPAVGWLEVHAENYMGGGPAVRALERIRRDYPISIHGVGLSLGTAGALDARHLERLAALADRLQPALVSEHLAWSAGTSGACRTVSAAACSSRIPPATCASSAPRSRRPSS